MPKVVVYVPVGSDAEIRAAGLDPAQIVRDCARKGIAETLEAVRARTPEAPGTERDDALQVAIPKARSRRRSVTPALDAVGTPTTDTTGKIGVQVVRAIELEEPSVDAPASRAKRRVRRRSVTPTLDAVGFPTTDAVGKIGVPVVRAADLDDLSAE